MTNLLCLSLFCLVQDPDLSTPEKAAESFGRYRQSLHESMDLRKARQEAQRVGLERFTEEYRSRFEEKAKQADTAADEGRVLNMSRTIAAKTENADGTVTFDVRFDWKQKRRDAKSQELTEVERSQVERYVLIKVGDQWRVKEYFRSCTACSGSGVCWSCKGTGKEAENRDCQYCRGAKACSGCKGMKSEKVDPRSVGIFANAPEERPQWLSDLSTPKSAAEAFADLTRRRRHEEGLATLKITEGRVKALLPFLTPDQGKEVEVALANAVRKGRDMFSLFRTQSVEPEVKGASAVVILTTKYGSTMTFTDRLELKKVGEAWLVDSVAERCAACKSSGKCASCQGSGKAGEVACKSCKGTAACARCEGKGWVRRD